MRSLMTLLVASALVTATLAVDEAKILEDMRSKYNNAMTMEDLRREGEQYNKDKKAREIFDSIDVDNDRRISAHEMANYVGHREGRSKSHTAIDIAVEVAKKYPDGMDFENFRNEGADYNERKIVERFQTIDADSDGFIDSKEMFVFLKRRATGSKRKEPNEDEIRAEMFGKYRAEGGRIDLDDFRADAERVKAVKDLKAKFSDIDLNRDSWIDPDEMHKYLKEITKGEVFLEEIAKEMGEKYKATEGKMSFLEFRKDAEDYKKKKLVKMFTEINTDAPYGIISGTEMLVYLKNREDNRMHTKGSTG